MTAVTLPEGTWDCHVHVFDPGRFPYAEDRNYTPGPATLDHLQARHRDWGVSGTVVVQASVHGTDNASLMDALRTLGSAGRGVAVVDPDSVSDETLADMQATGVVGMRVNLVSSSTLGQDPFQALVRRLQGSGMFLQVYAPLPVILENRSALEGANLPVVLDHFAGISPHDGEGDRDALSSLCLNAPVWIKLSADYRLEQANASQESPAINLIRRFWSAIPDRLIWGSDWPHTGGGATRMARPRHEIEPFRQVYALSVPELMAEAGLDAADRRRVLAENPLKLFGNTPNSEPHLGAALAVTDSQSRET